MMIKCLIHEATVKSRWNSPNTRYSISKPNWKTWKKQSYVYCSKLHNYTPPAYPFTFVQFAGAVPQILPPEAHTGECWELEEVAVDQLIKPPLPGLFASVWRGRWHVQLVHSIRSCPPNLCWCSAGVRHILPSCIDWGCRWRWACGRVGWWHIQYLGLLGWGLAGTNLVSLSLRLSLNILSRRIDIEMWTSREVVSFRHLLARAFLRHVNI